MNDFPEREKEQMEGRGNLSCHKDGLNWFSEVNLCSLFTQAMSKTGKHEMICRCIYFDNSRGCWGVIGTTWLLMTGTRHDGGVHMDYQHSSSWGFMEKRKE